MHALPPQVVNVVSGFGLSWQASFGVITLLYFYSHYLFASGAAHIGAMYTAFLSVAVACGTPGLLAAVALGQVSISPSVLYQSSSKSQHAWLLFAAMRRAPSSNQQQASMHACASACGSNTATSVCCGFALLA
jgi:hypothetical protein